MIKIYKDELEYLLAKGFVWKEHLHKTYSGNGHHYYATEDKKLMPILNAYRKAHKGVVYGEL